MPERHPSPDRQLRLPDWRLRALRWLAGRGVYSLFLAILVLIPVGTLGYILIGGLSPLDALYQTMITLTTVGYGDLATTTAGRIFNILFLTIGVGLFAVALSSLAAFLVEGRIRDFIGRQRMEREISELRDHVIVCGFGRFGQLSAAELATSDVVFAVLDADPDKAKLAEERGYLALHADATEESSLVRAGLEHARAVISTLSSDADNVYVALTSKGLFPEVRVVTLARDSRAEPKLLAAGADHVVSPYTIGALNMARHITRPHVTRFVEQFRMPGRDQKIAVQLEELPIHPGSPLVGRTLRETPLRKEYGLMVVAVVKAMSGEVLYSPEPDVALQAGDVLVCVGPSEGLERALAQCAPASPA